MSLDPPLALVSLTWREAPGAVRARAVEPVDDELRRSLRRQGVRGLIEIHTCARSTWVLSAETPAWAGALWQARVRRQAGVVPSVVDGEAAFSQLLRIAVGLDSYVQGEADIGGQVMRAFDQAREAGTSDVVLNQCGQSVAHLVAEGRDRGFVRPNRGVGRLSVEALDRLGVGRARPVGVVGLGDIGRRVMASLRRVAWEGVGYNRSPKPGALPLTALAQGEHEALVVCTAGPPGHLQVPDGVRVVVDIGLPAQVAPRPGVRIIGLDELLRGDVLALPSERLQRAEEAVAREAAILLQRVRTIQLRRGLSGMTELRDSFLADTLEAAMEEALVGLDEEARRRVLRASAGAIRRYNHRVLGWLKQELAGLEEP